MGKTKVKELEAGGQDAAGTKAAHDAVESAMAQLDKSVSKRTDQVEPIGNLLRKKKAD